MYKELKNIVYLLCMFLACSIIGHGANLPFEIENNNLTAYYGLNQIIDLYTPENVTWANASLTVVPV